MTSQLSAGAYIDQVSEAMVAAYTRERESWLRNQSTARARESSTCYPASGPM